MKNKKAYLSNNITDRISQDRDILYLNYLDYYNSNNKHTYYFFINNKTIDDMNIQGTIAANWFRENGKDIFKEHFSVGLLMERRLRFIFANVFKYYFAYKYWSEKYNEIELPSRMNRILAIVAKQFTNFSHDSNASIEYETDEYFLKRAHIKSIRPRLLPAILRFLQKITKINVFNKVLCFPDWTYNHITNKDFLYLNNKSIYKGFYFTPKKIKNNKKKLSLDLKEKIKSNLHNILIDSDLNIDDINSLESILFEVIINEYYDCIYEAEKLYATIEDAISYYKPKAIVIPTKEYCWYAMITQLTNHKNIDLHVLIDGYLSFADDYYFQRDRDNSGYLIKNYCAMGDYTIKLLDKYKDDIKLYNVQTPLQEHNSTPSNINKDYDAIILMPYPWTNSVNGLWDSRYQYLIDVIKVFKKLSINNFAIKIKIGHDSDELEKVKMITDADILSGFFHESIQKCKFIVGTLGTSLIQSILNDSPYYVYEPFYNGFSDKNFSNSIVKDSIISRNIEKLEHNLSNSNSTILSKSLIQGEITLSEFYKSI